MYLDVSAKIMKLQKYKMFEGDDEIYVERDDVLALEQESPWIPVSERLPGEDGFYLVTTDRTHNIIIDIAYYTDGIWHKASRILAWMPLPEPYTAGSEDKE